MYICRLTKTNKSCQTKVVQIKQNVYLRPEPFYSAIVKGLTFILKMMMIVVEDDELIMQ